MDTGIVGSAAYNNAAWCDAVCSTHSGPGEFAPGYWLTRHGAPEYYPDLVTLTGASDMARQVDALAAMVRAAPGRSLSVKDSFGCLDLGPLGFAPLFDAEWLVATESGIPVPDGAGKVRWVSIGCNADLTRWEQAWRPGMGDDKPSTFRPKLLVKPDIRFVYGLVGDRPVGGGILNATDDVTGLSNVFTSGIATEAVLQGLASIAWVWRPERPLVGYESGADLAAARRVGFEAVGRLCIWRRARDNSR